MDGNIELFSDGDGLAIIGSPMDVDMFLASTGLSNDDQTRSSRIISAAHIGGSVADAAAGIAENAGRWVKLTERSAAKVKQFKLMPTGTKGISHAMIGNPGEIESWIQIVTKPGVALTNPAVLAGVGGVMAQLAMKQQMDQITDYLATIDAKLDEVLRTQKNQMFAKMDAVALAIREASLLSESVGRVSDITWSKIEGTSITILETQAFALRQLADLADRLEQKRKIDELADLSEEAVAEVTKLLTVLARCFQLHDAIAVLELERVLDSSPEEIDKHRLGLRAAREDRYELIATHTSRLLERAAAAAELANSKVLLHPVASPAIVGATNQVAVTVHDFHEVLCIQHDHESASTRRWSEAANEARDRARVIGADGLDAAKRFGAGQLAQAKGVKAKLADKVSGGRLLQSGGDKASAD